MATVLLPFYKPQNSVTPGPTDAVSEWKWNNNFTDFKGVNNGSAIASPTFVTGQNGLANGAVQFDGSSQYVNVANSSSMKPAAITLETWVKLNSLTSTTQFGGASSAEMYFMSLSYNVAHGGNDSYAFYYSTGVPYFLINGIGYSLVGTISATGVWHHICGTYDGATVKTYFDGVLQSTTSYTTAIIYDTANNFTIGQRSRGTDQQTYNALTPGIFDDTQIFSRAITATEVANTYASQAAAREEKFRMAMQDLVTRLYIKFT